MKAIAIIIGAVFLAGVLVAACFAVVNNDDDQQNMGRIVLVSHQRCDPRWDDCGGDSYRNENGNRGDQSRCRGENCRGSFSPGPFDRSPLDFRNACISLNCSGRDDNRDRRRDDQPPPDESMVAQSLGCLAPLPWHCDQPQSLFPPTPAGIRDFVTNTIKSSIELGRLFADTTITFVENLMFGIA